MSQAVLILDRYEPVEVAAGEGASGIVTKARDSSDANSRLVAIKRPNSAMMSPAEARKKNEEIRREAKALSRINHFAACEYIDAGEWPDASSGYQTDFYVITAWAEGAQIEPRLRQLESTGRVLPYGEALEILDQLTSVLAHAHHHSIVHNDIDAKHLFWDQKTRQLKLIDWANCALLDIGETPNANISELDDLQQYGELMHRILTGTTLHVAERLGRDGDWQVEMRDKRVAKAMQVIVARAIQKHPDPYQEFQPLADDLHLFKQKAHKPYEAKVTEIEALISQARESIDRKILIRAQELIETVSKFDPSLVIGHQQDLRRLRQEWDEHAAIATAKAAMLNERWTIANQRISNVFGTVPETMPLEARRIHWYCLMMIEAKQGSEAYHMRRQAMDALFPHAALPDSQLALTYILLSYGTEQPHNHALLEDLFGETEDGYPTWRSQLSVSKRQTEALLGLTVSEQIKIYQGLQQGANSTQGSDNDQLGRLIRILTKANDDTEEAYNYPAARELFRRAFYLDPANFQLFYLSELMEDLDEVAQIPPSSRNYEDLYRNNSYQFAAASHYVNHARHKIDTGIKQGLKDTRRGLLAKDRERREIFEREKADGFLQCFWLMRDGYRALYDDTSSIEDRLRNASRLLEQADQLRPAESSDQLEQELEVLAGIIAAREELYKKGLNRIEVIRSTLTKLPHHENHVLVTQLQQELGQFVEFTNTGETVLNLCVERDYEQAVSVWQQTSENFGNDKAFEWLNPAKTSTRQTWTQFCENIQQGLASWEQRKYATAHARFSAVQQHIPIGVTGKAPAKIIADLEIILGHLAILKTEIAECRETLKTVPDHKTIQSLQSKLKTSLKSERALIRIIGGKPRFTASLALAEAFASDIQENDLNALQALLKQEQYQDDPLLSGYREIALRLTSVSILMTIRTGDLELAERQLNAQSDGQGQLPRILTVVAIIRRSYDVLETSPEQFVAQDRIEQAELTLEQGVSMLQESDPLELGDEIAILNELTSLYQGVNKAGSDFQEEAAARVDRLKADYGLGKKHKFVSRFEVELNALTLWYNQRQNIFEALNHNQFQKAHQLITDVPTRIRRAVTWLNEPDQPDWQGWETYLEEMIAIWSDVADEPAKYDLLEAANRLTVLSETIPAGLTSNQVAALKEKLAQDVVQLQTELRKLEDKEETRKDTLVIEGLRHLHEGSLAEALRLIEYAPSDGSTGCFRSLCMGYEYLYDEEKSLSTDERIDYARTALEQAQVHRPSQAVANALNKEQIILQRLIEVYDQLHSNAASWSDLTEAIGAIQEQPAATYLHKRRSGHFFVLKLTEQLAVLDKWVGHRNRAANFWFLGQYDRATRQLAQIKPEDETALNWLNETLQQEWADWKKFNGQIGQGLVNWRKYEYAATAAQFYQAKEHIPDGLSQDTAISLANKLSLMAADLSAIDQRLTYSRTLLQEAEAFYQDKTNLVLIREYLSWELFRYSSDSLLFDPFLYTVVGTQLEVARKLEHKWQTACKADYIGPIFTRFQRFTNHAISRDLKQLQKVIGEDFGKEDPLQQGYLNVESLIVKGLQPDAPRQDYTLARKLAPEQSSFQNEKVRQLFRGGVFPGCLVLAILVLFCIFTVLMTSIIAPAIWPNDESIAANDEPAPTSMNEQVAALPTVPTSISNPGATSNPTNIDPELQLTSTASEAGQEAVRAEPTATTTPSPAPSPEPTNSEQLSEVMSPTPTLTPTAEAPSLPTSRPGPTPAPVDLFTLAKWSPDELIWATTGPIIYQNADGQWNLRSDRTEGHVFWVQEVFQHFPLAVEANVFLGRPNGRYGLVVESVDRQKGFALHTQVDPLTDQGMYTIEIKHQDGESSQGSLLEYNTGFGKNVFEIKIREDLVEFIVNGQPVGTFQSDEKLEAGWRIGINLEVDGQLADSSGDNKRLGHLIIDPTDSIKVYQLPPLQ